ncbi:MAG: tetratricopeptide repeat protein [Burkholderiaceae bacterium]
MTAEVRVFLSTVSAEFRSYRDILRRYLERPNVSVKVQEDFIATGTETLDMLDEYIRSCDVVVHLVGDMTGAMAQAQSVEVIRIRYPDFASCLPVAAFLEADGPSLSYTQWEAWLSLYHRKRLIIAVPEGQARRDEGYVLDLQQQAAQQAHLARLAKIERHPGIRFVSPDQFAAEVWRSALLDILIEAGLVRRLVSLPYASLGLLFKGREALIEDMAARFEPAPRGGDQPAVAKVLTGLGGAGKTRLAIEYAWRNAGGYGARLLVGADSPEALSRGLAAMCGSTILNLPEQADTEESRQRDAVLRWLNQHAGWLLILDNVDTNAAATAVENLVPKLSGGHLLLTSRLSNWSAGIEPLPVDLIAPDAAEDFLLARTAGKRRPQTGDSTAARTLADELGYLPLALEQAAAYIAQRRITFEQYLDTWQQRRDEVLQWFDPRLMQYPKSVAITWQTSFDQLGEPAKRLLQRLSWLAADPIPESLLGISIGDASGADADPYDSLVELEAYSLVKREAERPYFSVHGLVQEVTRREQRDNSAHQVLSEALNWVNAAFEGDPNEVLNWPVLDPLVPHALAVAGRADEEGIPEPTALLLNQAGVLALGKALYEEAAPLMRRALAIDEANYGADHPSVAVRLNNLAQLLKATNRLAEAERLMRRSLAIDEASFGSDHPAVARSLNNLAQLLQATNRLAEAAPLMYRALMIDAASFGTDHADVARDLNNLAQLLQVTNHLVEAEPLLRRALAIDEANSGADHPNIAIGLNNLALLLQRTNRLSEAVPLMRRALAIDEASFGADHPNVAIRLNNLATLLKAANQLPEAERLMRRALAINEARLGADHPNVARDLNNLATLLRNTNRQAEIEGLMRRALMIVIRSLGLGHPSSQTVKSNYLALLHEMGKSDEEIAARLASMLADR